MRSLKLSQDVRPLSDLKSHGAEIVRQVTETGRPVVLSRHGRAVAVVLSVDEFDEMQERLEHLELQRAVEQGERDVAAGRVVDNTEVKELLKRWTADDE